MSSTRLAALAAMLSCALLLGVTSTAGAAQTQRDLTKQVPVTGTAKNGKKFKGTYTIDRFVSRSGKVFAVGLGKVKDDGSRQPPDVKDGDTILFGKYSGQEIKIDGEEYLIMREDEVLAILESK